jgi:hypothetical protein
VLLQVLALEGVWGRQERWHVSGACQLVQGRISPMGWCDLYAPA